MSGGNWIEGRAWVFADANINTDVMMPPAGRYVTRPERALLTFQAIRPGWAEQVREGDIVIGGPNFGTGSSRPAAEVFLDLGVRALVAETINGLFFRNCINYALPPLECAGILAAVTEGDIIAVNAMEGRIINRTTGIELSATRIPAMLMDIMQAGGLLKQMQAAGYVKFRNSPS